ncbi:MAG: CGNR zinc finger domain-containing protein [Actinomycetota bacterium]|nr:CGNR zinc finger domain-containing protein [Actinomycetota bacterium]
MRLAVALVNSAGDDLDELSEIRDFLDEYKELWEGVAQPPEASELDAIQALRCSLREVITAVDNHSAAEILNRILSDHGAVPRLSTHTGDPHLHFEPINSSMISWLGTTTAMGLAAVIVEHGVERFGECDSTGCNDVYVDTSRNRSRKHCSNLCSTREAVAAHRARKAD